MIAGSELENNLGISEKTLSEFIIDLAKGKKSVKDFKAALDANDAEFPMSLVETLWGIIQRLQVLWTRACCTLRITIDEHRFLRWNQLSMGIRMGLQLLVRRK